jgi:lysophospholipase L1-like esterase
MKFRKITKAIIVSAIVALVVLSLAEGILRLKDLKAEKKMKQQINALLKSDKEKRIYRRMFDMCYIDRYGCYRILPNSICWNKSNDDPSKRLLININSQGLRGEEPLSAPDKRIVFIGDSIVFAAEVRQEHTFVSLLEKYLNKGIDDRKAYKREVLNFGIRDTGIEQYYYRLKYHAFEMNPDFVFIGFYLNDSVSPQGYVGATNLDPFEKFLESKILINLKVAAYTENLYRMIKYTSKKDVRKRFRWTKRFRKKEYYSDKNELTTMIEEADLDWGAAWLPASWDKVRLYMEKIKEMCNARSTKLAVFCFPVEPQIYSSVQWADMDFPQRQLRKICEELKIPYYDLLPSLKKFRNKEMMDDQCHFNRVGNRIVASELYAIIKDNPEIFTGL